MKSVLWKMIIICPQQMRIISGKPKWTILIFKAKALMRRALVMRIQEQIWIYLTVRMKQRPHQWATAMKKINIIVWAVPILIMIMKAYRPFIYLVWAGCINSFLTLLLPMYSRQPFFENLLYDLCQAILLTWFYRNIGAFRKTKILFYGLIIIFIGLFIGESIWD